MPRIAKSRGGDSSRKIPRTLAHVALCGVALSLVAVAVALSLLTMELRRLQSVSNADKTIVLNLGRERDPFRFDASVSFPSLSLKLQTSQSNDVGETGPLGGLPREEEEMPTAAVGTVESVYGVTKLGDGEESVYGVTKHGEGEESVEEVLARLGTTGSLLLTADNFDHYLREYQILVVNFFVQWSHWCRSLAPAWEIASAIINQSYKGGRIQLARLDCTQYKTLCEKHEIQGYPSIQVFRNGSDIIFDRERLSNEHEVYYGARDTDSLVRFAESLVSNTPLDNGAAASGPESVHEVTKQGDEEKGSVEEVHARLAQERHEYVVLSPLLTADNFDSYLKEYEILVVNFFAPWCNWCQSLEPAWDRASTIVNQRGERFYPEYNGKIRLVKVDCVQNQRLCWKHEVQGYPSIRVFRKGSDLVEHHGHHKHESYYGERDTDSLLKFVDSLVLKAPMVPDSAEIEYSARGDIEEASGFHPGKPQRALLDKLRGLERRLTRTNPGNIRQLKSFTEDQEIPKNTGPDVDYM